MLKKLDPSDRHILLHYTMHNEDIVSLVFPCEHDSSVIRAREYDLKKAKCSYVHNCVKNYHMTEATKQDIQYIMDEIREDENFVVRELRKYQVEIKEA